VITRHGLARRLIRGLAGAVVVLSIAFVVLMRANLIGCKTQMEHDESITYLAATGHQGEYERVLHGPEALTGRWTPASEWRRLLRPEHFGVFATISRDLAATDVHPALYFWLLHLWVWVAGVSVTSGPHLNLIFTVLTAGALFGLARRVLRAEGQAAAVVAIWCLSLPAAEVSSLARPYDLMAMITVFLVWQALSCAGRGDRAPWRESIVVCVITAAGALTHHHFAIVAVGTAFVVVALTWRQRAPTRMELPFRSGGGLRSSSPGDGQGYACAGLP
jgi:hypothetical protein